MVWRIELNPASSRKLEKLERQAAQRITRFLQERVAVNDNPRLLGEALQGPLRGYWKYRVGDFRLICDIQDARLLVLVLEIGNRRDIYR